MFILFLTAIGLMAFMGFIGLMLVKINKIEGVDYPERQSGAENDKQR